MRESEMTSLELYRNNHMLNETETAIVPTESTSLVQSMTQDTGRVTHTYLSELDKDPSFNNVEGVLADIAGVVNDASWLIGDILVFVRERANFHTVITFDWDGVGEFPPEVSRFIFRNYGVRRIDQVPEPVVEFACWHALKWPKFWILYRPGEIRIWERLQRVEWTEVQFDKQLQLLGGRLFAQLNDRSMKTLRNYYKTSLMFPPSKRSYQSWTWHYEQCNKAGMLLPPDVVGEERIHRQAALAQQNAELDTANGRDRVEEIREDIHQGKVQARGWDWHIPPPKVIQVIDTVTGELLDALQLTSHPACKAILGATGKVKWYGKYPDLLLGNGVVEDTDGNVVAHCPLMDENKAVGQAIIELAGKMRWTVKRG